MRIPAKLLKATGFVVAGPIPEVYVSFGPTGGWAGSGPGVALTHPGAPGHRFTLSRAPGWDMEDVYVLSELSTGCGMTDGYGTMASVLEAGAANVPRIAEGIKNAIAKKRVPKGTNPTLWPAVRTRETVSK